MCEHNSDMKVFFSENSLNMDQPLVKTLVNPSATNPNPIFRSSYFEFGFNLIIY